MLEHLYRRGVDSSAIVSIVDEIKDENQKFKTYSARFNDVTKDEGKWIDLITKSKDVIPHEVFLEEDLVIDELEKVIWHHETPVASSAVFAQFAVMRLAH